MTRKVMKMLWELMGTYFKITLADPCICASLQLD